MFKNSAEQPLLLHDDSSTGVGGGGGLEQAGVRLYEPSVVLEMKASIAEGYLTLLTGGNTADSKKAESEEVNQLAFASLTSGNVIEACFGAIPNSNKTSFANTLSKEAKEAIEKATLSDEKLEAVAVEAYKSAFRTVVDMNKKLSGLNILFACFCSGSIRSKAQASLESGFRELEQAILQTN